MCRSESKTLWYTCSKHKIHTYKSTAPYSFPYFAQLCVVICVNLFVCGCCLIAGASDIPSSLMSASLASLVPSLPSGPRHSSARYAPYPCLWSYPSKFIIEKNLQCISPGVPCISNGVDEGGTLISPYSERPMSCVTWQKTSGMPVDWFAKSYWWKSYIGGRQSVGHRHKEIITKWEE